MSCCKLMHAPCQYLDASSIQHLMNALRSSCHATIAGHSGCPRRSGPAWPVKNDRPCRGAPRARRSAHGTAGDRGRHDALTVGASRRRRGSFSPPRYRSRGREGGEERVAGSLRVTRERAMMPSPLLRVPSPRRSSRPNRIGERETRGC
jgi:hypothetical protein